MRIDLAHFLVSIPICRITGKLSVGYGDGGGIGKLVLQYVSHLTEQSQ